jgi:hypothetical protein
MFKDLNFNLLKKKIDQILFSRKINKFVISNGALNLVKGHPFYLKVFFANENFLKKLFLYLIKNFIFIFISLFNFNLIKKKTKKKSQILLVSNLVDVNFSKNEDYIYGKLESFLKKKKITFTKLYVNHLSKNNLSNKFKNNFSSDLIDFKTSNLFVIIKLTIHQLYYFFIYFLITIYKVKEKNLKKLYFNCALEFLSINTKKNLILAENFKKNIKKKEFDLILIPFEGYSWERLILNEVRSKSKRILRIGYNFSVISKTHNTIFRYINKNFEPDLIYCTGKYSKDRLTKKINIPIKIFGSKRSLKIQSKKKINSKSINCLVAPEGIESECIDLFNLSFEAALNLQNVKFIWRLHPLMNFSDILKKLNLKKNLIPKNIILSKKNFKQDIKRSDCCLYRGSSSIIILLQSGVYPIYFNKYRNLNIDPVYELKKWKKSIKNSRELTFFLDKEFKIEKNKIFLKKQAKKFANRYFEPLNYKRILFDVLNYKDY